MLYSRGALYTVRDLPASNGTEPGTLATRAQCAGRLLCHPPLQVCVPHGVVAWELGRAKSCDLGSENSRQGKIVLSGSLPHEPGEYSLTALIFLQIPLLSAQIAVCT